MPMRYGYAADDGADTDLIVVDISGLTGYVATSRIHVKGFWVKTDANVTLLTLHFNTGPKNLLVVGASAFAQVYPCDVIGAAAEDLVVTTTGTGVYFVGVNYDLI